MTIVAFSLALTLANAAAPARAEAVPTLPQLLAHPVKLRPELEGVHPRVFVTAQGLEKLRERARTTHKEEWTRVLAGLKALAGPPPPPPGPQARRSQNVVAFNIAEAALAYAIERKPEYLKAAKAWTMAAIDYEPWGYTYNKPNVDLAAGHLLYAIGWAYDLLFHDFTADERKRIRTSLERHAQLLAAHFTPDEKGKKKFAYTQNHDFIPTAGLAVTALALLGESPQAPAWGALARAHHHRAGQMLSPDGYYYEGFEYWIFSSPWLVHFLDAWEHATGESLWDRPVFRNWKHYVAHSLLPNGQDVFDYGDIWEGPKTRARQGEDAARAYPGGTLESNYGVLYRVASRLKDPEAQAVAERLRGFGHQNQQECLMLLWRDAELAAAPMAKLPLAHHFQDSGVVMARTSWEASATAWSFKAGPPQGHRVAALLAQMPDARLDSGHAHPDAGSFIVWAGGKYLVGDTGYSGTPAARQHNTITVGGVGQGREGRHDVWREMPYTAEGLGRTRITQAKVSATAARIVADVAGAYPTEAGLRRFVRTFTFRAPGTFTISDVVETQEPKVISWYLHADAAFEGDLAVAKSPKFATPAGAGAGVRLEGVVRQPRPVKATTAETKVLAPGPPGSIEKGVMEPRGHELVLETPEPTRTTRFDVTLTVKGAPARQAQR